MENKNLIIDDIFMYELADFYKVFGDSTRLKIMYVLMEAEKSVTEIGELVNMSQSSVSHQLRILRQNGLVKFVKDGKKVIYSLDDNHVTTLLQQGIVHLKHKKGEDIDE